MTTYDLLLIQAEEYNRFLKERSASLGRLQQRQLERFYRWLEAGVITRTHLREIVKERRAWAAEWDDNGRRLTNLKAKHCAEQSIATLVLEQWQTIRHLLSKTPMGRF